MYLLKVSNLKVAVDEVPVIKNVNLKVKTGETALLMGPNGSGKTTLIQSILGNPKYRIISGKIFFEEEDITDLSMEERVSRGITVAFQIPPRIRGITLGELARNILERRGVEDVEGELYRIASALNLVEMLNRELNVGFSGGEMKRAELLLLIAQKPRLALLDEIDSGVDVENIAIMGKALTKYLISPDTSVILITHTGYIAKYVKADVAYVMMNGEIKCRGKARKIVRTILESGFEMCTICEGVWEI